MKDGDIVKKKEKENYSIFTDIKYKMVLYSILIGLVSGAVVCSYRLVGSFFLGKMVHLINFSKINPTMYIVSFAILIVMSIIVSYCVMKEPNASGSGIPQVEGEVEERIEPNWKSVLIYKYLGGALSLAGGLSIGREGPSVQIGAAIGKGISKGLNKKNEEHRYLLTSGAAAGLASTFNAPLAGAVFALEEIQKKFSPVVLLSAMVAAVSSDFVTKIVFGFKPELYFSYFHTIPLKQYWTLIVLGVVIGVSSYIFNNGTLVTKHIYEKMPIHPAFKMMIPFICSGVIAITCPLLLGGGEKLIMSIDTLHLGILALLGLVTIKFLFTFISFSSGVPGGIFFPLLAIGSLLGAIVGMFFIKYCNMPSYYLMNFAVFAMAAHFGAIVKAPITGVILVIEMTGSLEHLLPVTLVVLVALVVSDILKVTPIYDDLLDEIIEKQEKISNK